MDNIFKIRSVSLAAKGLWCFLRNGDVHDPVELKYISQQLRIPRDTAKRLLNELYDARLLYSFGIRDNKGHFKGRHCFIFDFQYNEDDLMHAKKEYERELL